MLNSLSYEKFSPEAASSEPEVGKAASGDAATEKSKRSRNGPAQAVSGPKAIWMKLP